MSSKIFESMFLITSASHFKCPFQSQKRLSELISDSVIQFIRPLTFDYLYTSNKGHRTIKILYLVNNDSCDLSLHFILGDTERSS